MFALNDIVTWTHPRTGNTHTGVSVVFAQQTTESRHSVLTLVKLRINPNPVYTAPDYYPVRGLSVYG